jgi:hypothetical protein
MDQVDAVITRLLEIIKSFVDLVLAGLAAIEMWVRTQLIQLGVPPAISLIILIALALLLIVAALRLFGGIVYAIVIIFLILLAIHALMPVVTTP